MMENDKIRQDRQEPQEDTMNVSITERKRWGFFGLPFTFTTYTLTPKKLTVRQGVITTTEDDILLYRVMDTSLTRTLLQKIFKLGTLKVISSDKTLPNLEIKNIRNYKAFKDLLEESVEKERLRMRLRTGEMIDAGVDGFGDDYPEM